jgi:hypothetical protein
MLVIRALVVGLTIARIATAPPCIARELVSARADIAWPATAKALAVHATREEMERSNKVLAWSCPRGQTLDAFEVWRGINDAEAAKRFLRDNYSRAASRQAFLEWLGCQGFRLRAWNGPIRRDRHANTLIVVSFAAIDHGGRSLWRRVLLWPPIYGQSFNIFFDSVGNITRIEYEESVE